MNITYRTRTRKMERDESALIHSFCSSSGSGYFPRLPIFSLLAKSPDDRKLPFSPPLSMQVSVPFQWEEVPGKPKAFYAALKMDDFAVCEDQLRLPPRLLYQEEEEEDSIIPLSDLVRKQLMETISESDSLGGKAEGIGSDRTKKKKKKNKAVMKLKRRSGFFRFFQRKFNSWAAMYQSFRRMGSNCSCRL